MSSFGLAAALRRQVGFGMVHVVASTATEPNPDEQLAASLRADDPAVIEVLWDAYGDAVYAIAVRVLADRAAAEDVRQQVFAEVWERRGSYDPARGPVRAWVMAVARSRAIDQYRRRRRVPEVVEEPEAFDRIAAAPDSGTSPDDVMDRVRMAELLRRIPVQEAGLLRMRFYEELTQTEIAERTGLPLGTVKMRMVQALERLRDLLEAEGAEP